MVPTPPVPIAIARISYKFREQFRRLGSHQAGDYAEAFSCGRWPSLATAAALVYVPPSRLGAGAAGEFFTQPTARGKRIRVDMENAWRTPPLPTGGRKNETPHILAGEKGNGMAQPKRRSFCERRQEKTHTVMKRRKITV
eukprot:GHVT01059387.1.p1 GENE.GHVT01059387.1~~GHVT01059387.1.p1  ORF type:complete len:140 (+),score=18.49 GHVT01059387.1:974-1393(+)